MKVKKLLSWGIILFCLTFLRAVPANAENYGILIAGVQVTDANCNNLGGISPKVTVAADGVFKYEHATKTLTMKDVTISTTSNVNAILNNGVGPLTIVVNGSNSLNAFPSNVALDLGDYTTTIKGDGKLTIKTEGSAGIYTQKALTISDITLTTSGTWGIYAEQAVTLNNVTLIAKGSVIAVTELKSLNMTECQIMRPKGGSFSTEKNAIVDQEGNKAKEVIIARIAKIAFAQPEVSVIKGKKLTLELNKTNIQADEVVTLTSSAVDKVTVATDGTLSVEGVSEGEATITANIAANDFHDELTATCKVKVAPKPSIAFAQAEVTVIEGKKLMLELNKTNIQADEVVTLTSSAADKVTVATDGTLTVEGVAEGEATLTATIVANANHDELTATCKVKVAPKPSIAFAQAEVTVIEGKKLTLVLNKTNIQADEVVTLTSSAVDKVTVATDGTLTVEGVAEGVAIITATIAANDNHEVLTATCKVKVAPKPSIAFAQAEVTVIEGKKLTLVLNKTNIQADEVVTLTSSAADKVKVATDGTLTVEGVAEGEATLTATIVANANHDELTATCKVKVAPKPAIVFAQAEVTVIEGKKLTLVLNKTNIQADEVVTLTSSAADKVKVATDGTLTIEGVAEGEATLTATIVANANHDELTATCKVKVAPKPSIAFAQPEVSVIKGKKLTLELNKTNIQADEVVTLTSNAADKVKVATDGTLTVEGVAEGVAIITATIAANENHEVLTATCKVKVTVPTAVENALFANIVIAPNPFANQLRISNGELRGTYVLLNAQGVVVRSGKMDSTGVMIETNDLASGLFLLQLTVENGATKTYRVVK